MWSRRSWARAWRRAPCACAPRPVARWDAVVVGAGPAGSATARLLAQAGARVLLLDRAQFPRDKPCSEYLSPQSTRVLEHLGPDLVRAVEAAAPAQLYGMKLVAPSGRVAVGRLAGGHRGQPPPALRLPL